MKDVKKIKHFTDEEVKIGVEIDFFEPARDGGRCSPSDPAEVEFRAYFINGADEVICMVPDEMIGYFGLYQRVLEHCILEREQAKVDVMIDDFESFKTFGRMIMNRREI